MEHAFTFDQVVNGVWRISTPFGGRTIYNYLVTAGNGFVLFDTGLKDTSRAVLQLLQSLKRKITDITTILLSHSHNDHIGALAELAEASGATVFAHAQAQTWMLDHERQFLERFSHYKKSIPLPKRAHADFFEQLGRPWLADKWLTQFPHTMALSRKMEILHTPGHSPDCLALFLPEARIVLCGDAFGGAGVAEHLPYYTDVEAYRNTLSLLEALKPALLLSGHFQAIHQNAIPAALQQSRRLTEQLHEFICHALKNAKKGLTVPFLTEMVCARFGRVLTPQAATTVLAHLQAAADHRAAFEEKGVWRFGNAVKATLPVLPGVAPSASQ